MKEITGDRNASTVDVDDLEFEAHGASRIHT